MKNVVENAAKAQAKMDVWTELGMIPFNESLQVTWAKEKSKDYHLSG